MSAEDLTIQAGLALQQDLALVSLLGLGHVERNGHHYVDGMAALSPASSSASSPPIPISTSAATAPGPAAHPRRRVWRSARSAGPGFASGAAPDWASMRETP